MSGWDIPGLPDERPASVEDALDYLGIEYDDRSWGNEITALCPFHEERRPSFGINSSTGLWLCRAGCGQGDLARLVELLLGVPYARARRWVRYVDYGAVPEDAPDREPVRLGDTEFPESAIDWATDPPASALRDRGISRAAAAEFGILWDDDDGSWILPFRNPVSNVLRGWQTKYARQTVNTPQSHKSRTLFGIDVFETGGVAILVESPLDVAVLLTAGFTGGLASFGAEVSRAQAGLLSQRAGEIIIALDNDDAGRAGEAKLLDLLAAQPGRSRPPVWSFGYGDMKGKDVGELDDEEIVWGIEHATPRAK